MNLGSCNGRVLETNIILDDIPINGLAFQLLTAVVSLICQVEGSPNPNRQPALPMSSSLTS
jgi:hypothetical protein